MSFPERSHTWPKWPPKMKALLTLILPCVNIERNVFTLYQEEYFLYTMTLWVCQGNFQAFEQRYSWINDIEGELDWNAKKKKTKKTREFKGPWHASAHVLHFDFWSGELFFKIGFWWKNPFSLTLRRPRKLLYQYSRAIWFILEVLNAIFCILRQALSRKFEVIEEKCTKAYYLLSAFLQADQMWRLMWSSGFHFCLLSSPVNDLPFSVKC